MLFLKFEKHTQIYTINLNIPMPTFKSYHTLKNPKNPNSKKTPLSKKPPKQTFWRLSYHKLYRFQKRVFFLFLHLLHDSRRRWSRRQCLTKTRSKYHKTQRQIKNPIFHFCYWLLVIGYWLTVCVSHQ